MTEPGELRPTVAVAAGLLEAVGELTPELTLDTATEHLRGLLTPAALWRPAGEGGESLEGFQGVPPRWVPPASALSASLADRIESAWDSIVADHRSTGEPVLRVTVGGPADADQLATLHDAGGVRLVPAIETHPMRFAWRWPVRVAVADCPSAATWVDELRAGPFAGELYEVRIEPVGHETADDVDILLVDASVGLPPGDVVRPFQAACVMVIGDTGGATGLLERAVRADTTIAVGLPAVGVGWFAPFLEELAHDQPVDVAITRIVPEARVAASPELSPLTAVGRWAQEVAGRLDRSAPGAPDVDLVDLVASTAFDHERQGARQIAAASRAFEEAGVDTVLDIRFAMAEAPPPPAPAPAPDSGSDGSAEPDLGLALPGAPPVPPPITMPAPSPGAGSRPRPSRQRKATARRLLAEVIRDGKVCDTALAPDADHSVEVRIAVPRKRSEGVAFDESGVPTGSGVADLVIDVSSEDGSVHGTAPLSLPTLDRTLPSTVAVLPFRTGPEGSLLRLRITVLHKGRPIQAAQLVASVRAVASRHDAVALLPLQLTADPEPRAAATSADATVDATTSTLARLGVDGTARVDLANGEEILDLLEQEASRVLGTDAAPGALSDPEALDLLVRLARRGSQLRDLLADLDLDDAATIAVLVRYDSRVVPFELAYDGPAPEPTAKLCAHAEQPPAPGDRGCSRVSTRRVCPYAFWGVNRVIARTIERRPVRRFSAAAPRPGPLALRPVLYAAAERADRDSPPEARPSDLLEQTLARLVGPDKITRVTSWRAWRGAVRRTRPQMLVVLGHTEIEQAEATIEIGRRSRLAQPSVTSRVLGSAKAPAPVVVLLACASAVTGDAFGALPATFTDKGAAAVVATLTKLKGQHGADAAAAVVTALRGATPTAGTTLGSALTDARRSLLADGLLVGLLLVAHGEIDVQVTA